MMAIPHAVIATYNANADKAVYADIKGVWADDRSRVDYPEGITLQPSGRQYQTATLTSDRLTFD